MAAIGTALMLVVGFLAIIGRIAAAILFVAGLYLVIFKSVAVGLMVIGASVLAPFVVAGVCGVLGALGAGMVERGIEKHSAL